MKGGIHPRTNTTLAAQLGTFRYLSRNSTHDSYLMTLDITACIIHGNACFLALALPLSLLSRHIRAACMNVYVLTLSTHWIWMVMPSRSDPSPLPSSSIECFKWPFGRSGSHLWRSSHGPSLPPHNNHAADAHTHSPTCLFSETFLLCSAPNDGRRRARSRTKTICMEDISRQLVRPPQTTGLS